MKFTRISLLSGTENIMDLPVTQEQILKYLNGAFIQDAFPNLTRSEREFILTGITHEEWIKVFGETDD